MTRRRQSWFKRHSLSCATGLGVLVWLLLYLRSDYMTHAGSFFGNSIADWMGSFVTVVSTKFWFEKGSVESRFPPRFRGLMPAWIRDHSLTIVLVITCTFWIGYYLRLDPNGKTGQVVGNIVSEWGQIISLVWFTKYLYERG